MSNTRMHAVLLTVLVVLPAAVLISHPGRAEAAPPFVVTSAGDADDGVCNAAHCTLREAINAANANANAFEMDTINFNITGAGPHEITPGSGLPLISQPLKIDGTTQPGTVCAYPGRILKIHLVGGGTANGLSASGVTLVVLGLSFTGFPGTAITTSFGSGHEFRCNHIGVGPAGEESTGNDAGLRLTNSSGANYGGPNPADRNVISDNGFGLVLNGSSNVVVYGNYMGTTVDGATALPNGYGIYGGGNSESSFLANVIVATTAGVYMGGNQSGLVFESNVVNYGANGTTPLGTGAGIGIGLFANNAQTSTNHTIGGTAPGLANRIRAGQQGIVLTSEGTGTLTGVSIRGNQVKMTSGRAIGLLLGGQPTATIPNDNLDADTNGPNLLQNFPVVTGALPGGNVTGTLHSSASAAFTVDFYASANCSNRSAERYLGSVAAVTIGSGNATFDTAALGSFNAGEGITATATDEAGNTSELSACFVAGAGPSITSLSPEGVVAGSSETIVTVNGMGFLPATTVLWNNAELPTTYVNATTLQFTATTALIGNEWSSATIRLEDEDQQVTFEIWRSSSDVDCDGTATAEDAFELMRVVAGYPNSACQTDANKSGGNANLADVVHIRREIADLIEPLKSDVIVV